MKRLSEPHPTVKHLLYGYRVLFTGIHLMRTGEVVSNVTLLNEIFNNLDVRDLVDRKRRGTENMRLTPSELAHHLVELRRLVDQLDLAHDQSTLPEEPSTMRELNDFVVRLRLDGLPR